MRELVEVKTAELVGTALDWAVAKCSGMPFFTRGGGWPGNYSVTVLAGEKPVLIFDLVGRIWREHQGITVPWSPSTDWGWGGPLLDEHGVWLSDDAVEHIASIHPHINEFIQTGPTKLIAACRAIVHAKLGGVVQVPKELEVEE